MSRLWWLVLLRRWREDAAVSKDKTIHLWMSRQRRFSATSKCQDEIRCCCVRGKADCRRRPTASSHLWNFPMPPMGK